MRYGRHWRAVFIIASAVGIFLALPAQSQTGAPEVDANWGVRLNITLLYPTERPAKPIENTEYEK